MLVRRRFKWVDCDRALLFNTCCREKVVVKEVGDVDENCTVEWKGVTVEGGRNTAFVEGRGDAACEVEDTEDSEGCGFERKDDAIGCGIKGAGGNVL